MITRLEVDGFKSLSEFAIDLEPLTVLIGPNSAGKSNILEALALLSRLASQPIVDAFQGGRGRVIDQFARRGGKPSDSIRFALEFLLWGRYPRNEEPFQSRYRYELTVQRRTLASGVERLRAGAERFYALAPSEDRWIEAHPEFASVAGYRLAGDDLFITEPGEGQGRRRVIGLPRISPEEKDVPQTHTALSRLEYMGLHQAAQNLEGCRFLQIDAARLGEPSEPVDLGGLLPDASNLPTVLAGLPAPLLGQIRADLVSLVPGVASFEVLSEGDELHLYFDLSGGERLPARLVSNGTLRILALLTSLRLEPRPSLLGIEELENGIYPARLRALLELLKDEAARWRDDEASLAPVLAPLQGALGFVAVETNLLPTQLLLTTHSPVLLSVLRSSPVHLRFVDTVRRDGHRCTRVRAAGEGAVARDGRHMVSLREIDSLLHTAQPEEQ